MMKLADGGRRARGFTLVELMVCIAIMVILAMVLIAVVRTIQGKAMDTRCVHQVRQLGQAGVEAAQESNGYLAASVIDTSGSGTTTYWWEVVAPHIYSTYGSPPNDKKLDGLFRDPASEAGKKYGDKEFREPVPAEIGWAPWINNENVPEELQKSQPGIRLNLLVRPGGQPYLSTAVNKDPTAGISNRAEFAATILPAAKLHRDQVISYYCDLHAEVVKVKKDTDYPQVAPAMPDAN